MVRKLILSDSGFPEKFNSSSISPPSGISKQQYIENQIIEKINKYNPKLKVSNIEYLKIVEQFPHLDFFEMYFGLIVEEFEINELKKDLYKDVEYYIWENGGKYFCRKKNYKSKSYRKIIILFYIFTRLKNKFELIF